MTSRTDSPWYPTMRLFRQTKQGDWPGVIRDVTNALAEAVRDGVKAPKHATSAQAATLEPRLHQRHALPGLTGVAETVAGIVQYDPEEPIVGRSIEYYGESRRSHVDLLARLMITDSVVLEVSPGVGMHVLSLARAVGERGHFFLYEPRPLLAQLLTHNLAANRVENATVMKRTLAGAGLSDNDARDADSETIDDLRLEALHWIKIGDGDHAARILQGATEALWRLRPKLFIAVCDRTPIAQLCAFTRDFGYACWQFETPLFNPANFNLRDTDIFEGRTSFAVIAIPEEVEPGIGLDECVRIS